MLSIVVACLPQTKHVSLRDVSASNRCILPAGVEACALVAASTAASQETAELHSIVQSYFKGVKVSWGLLAGLPRLVCACPESSQPCPESTGVPHSPTVRCPAPHTRVGFTNTPPGPAPPRPTQLHPCRRPLTAPWNWRSWSGMHALAWRPISRTYSARSPPAAPFSRWRSCPALPMRWETCTRPPPMRSPCTRPCWAGPATCGALGRPLSLLSCPTGMGQSALLPSSLARQAKPTTASPQTKLCSQVAIARPLLQPGAGCRR